MASDRKAKSHPQESRQACRGRALAHPASEDAIWLERGEAQGGSGGHRTRKCCVPDMSMEALPNLNIQFQKFDVKKAFSVTGPMEVSFRPAGITL